MTINLPNWWGRLVVAVGRIGSKNPADPTFRDQKEKRLVRVPIFSPQNPAKGMLNSLGTHPERVFAWHTGSTATYEHYQELKLGLLHLWPLLEIVSSVQFPMGEEVTREPREVRWHIGWEWDLFPVRSCTFLTTLSVWLGYLDITMFQAMTLIYFGTMMVLYAILVFMEANEQFQFDNWT